MFPVWQRKPKASKPVAADTDVISVRLRRLGGPNLFAQDRKTIVVIVGVTTMQRMSHPVSSLRPPPDIALECIC